MSSATQSGSTPDFVIPSVFPSPIGYDPFPKTLTPYVAAAMFELFLYGIYTVLFSICFYILMQRRKAFHWILPTLVAVMFTVATADVSYSSYIIFGCLLKGALTFDQVRPKYWLYVTNNVLADFTLLYRCYVVWGGNLKIMVLPVLMLTTSVVCGYTFEGSTSELFTYSWIYVLLTFLLNVFLTFLIASRIWWLAWKGKNILDKRSKKKYFVAMAAILESGLLTSLYMLPDLILESIVLDAAFAQVVGIVPTLIVVQIGLGRAVKIVDEDDVTLQPIALAQVTSTQNQPDSEINHKNSFYSDGHTAGGTMRFKDDEHSRRLSLGSVPGHQGLLRTGEDRITMEEKPETCREGFSYKQEFESEGGRDPEKVLDGDDLSSWAAASRRNSQES